MLNSQKLFEKNFYYVDIGVENSIQIVFEKAISLTINNQHISNEVLIVADDMGILEHEVSNDQSYGYLSNDLEKGVDIKGVHFICCDSKNISNSFNGIIIAFFSDFDSLKEICYSNAEIVLFIPGSDNVLYEVIHALGAKKL